MKYPHADKCAARACSTPLCHHAEQAHSGHTQEIGGRTPVHCSMCACPAYTPDESRCDCHVARIKELEDRCQHLQAARDELARLNVAGHSLQSWAELEAENARLRAALQAVPPDKLRLLANWLDTVYPYDPQPEVQADLRQMANLAEAALKKAEGR